MATERQIEANRRNAARSTGPTSEAGKARSRANAIKHGMAGASAMVEAGLSAEFEERRAKWAAEYSPAGEAGNWAMDRAVAASLRIERCERALDELTHNSRERARLAWDQDRAVEAATIFGRLARDPVLVPRQLETTLAGVKLLLESWLGLVEALDAPGGWSDVQGSTALDLLGVPAELRSGRTPIDGPEGAALAASRRALALEEIGRLEGLRDEAMIPLDDLDRRQAMSGDVALLSKPAKLVLRYERDAWRRHRESIREVQSSAPPSGVVPPSPAARPAPGPGRPARVEGPGVRERTAAPPARSFAEERRALLEEAATAIPGLAGRFGPVDLDDEDAWLDDLERRLDDRYPAHESSLPGTFIPIAAGARAPGR